jgi:hypothetical protein
VAQRLVVRRHQVVDVGRVEPFDEPADQVALSTRVSVERAAQPAVEAPLVELGGENVARVMLLGAAEHPLQLEVRGAQRAESTCGSPRTRRRPMDGVLAGSEMRGQPHDGVHGVARVEGVERLLVSVRQRLDEEVISTGDRLRGHGRFLP